MKTKIIRVDFYRIDSGGINGGFEALLAKIAGMPDNEARTFDVGFANPVRMGTIALHNRLWQGEVTRIRMDDVPIRASKKGPKRPIDLRDDEGVGEETAFLYDPKTRYLAIQRNRIGVSAHNLLYYISGVTEYGSAIIAELALDPSVLQRLERLDSFRKVSLKVTGIDGGHPLQDVPSIGGVFKKAEDLRAPSVEISLGVGRGRSSPMVKERAKAFIRELLRWASIAGVKEDVQYIEVSGKAPEDEPEIIDLIKERLTGEHEVTYAENRTIPYESRRNAVLAVYRKNFSAQG